jgi:hypothetical protein
MIKEPEEESKEPEEGPGRVRGKVAAVLDERELAINVGSTGGVKLGMKFKVLADAAQVFDPDTNEVLGIVRREKVRVEAVMVRKRMSICRTYRTTGMYITEFLNLSKSAMDLKSPERLKAQDSAYLSKLSEEESYVKRGDEVVELTERESN